jgi:hypothetical protein
MRRRGVARLADKRETYIVMIRALVNPSKDVERITILLNELSMKISNWKAEMRRLLKVAIFQRPSTFR